MRNIAVHIYITGKVQGVWYRQSTKIEAEKLNLTGWVKNLPDGCVEAYVEGDQNSVELLVEWCYQGPPLSIVENVRVERKEFSGQFHSFTIRDAS